jgi:hypothetical protein
MLVFLQQAGMTFYPESAEESTALGVVIANLKVGLPPELESRSGSGSVEPLLLSALEAENAGLLARVKELEEFKDLRDKYFARLTEGRD